MVPHVMWLLVNAIVLLVLCHPLVLTSVLQESMVISASNRACVKTVRHVIQSLVLAVVQQAGKVSSVNKAVLTVGMAQDATVAVIVCITPPVIT